MFEGPPQTRLRDLLARVRDGAADPRSAAASLEAFLTGVEAMASEFEATLQGQQPEVAGACSEEADQVRHGFSQCHRLAGHLLSGNSDDWGGLVDAHERLEQSLIRFREAGLRALGPTGLPDVNRVLHLAVQWAEGGSVGPVVQDAARRLCDRLELLLTDPGQDPDLMEVVRQLRDTLAAFGETDPSRPEFEALYSAVAELAQAWEALAADPLSPLSWVERLRELALGLDAGTVSEETWLEELDRQRREISGLADRLQPSGQASARFEELRQAAMGRLERLELLLAEMETAAPLEPWLEEVAATWAALNEITSRMSRAAESEGMLPCVRCGQLNPPENRVCGACSAVMPRMAAVQGLDLQEGGATHVAPNLARLIRAVEAYQDGVADRNDLGAEVAQLRTLVATAHSMIPGGEPPPRVKRYLEGLDRLARALQRLPELSRGEDMSRGLAEVVGAFQVVQSALAG
ncbi:MAG: hypothetical protein AB1758_29945 [Candidatus Eremiobacterota bacterium]